MPLTQNVGTPLPPPHGTSKATGESAGSAPDARGGPAVPGVAAVAVAAPLLLRRRCASVLLPVSSVAAAAAVALGFAEGFCLRLAADAVLRRAAGAAA
eukprot:227909-Chlamydomonas_euryale.AAC.1